MVWSEEFHQQWHLLLKIDPFAITVHVRLQEKDKVTYTWLPNLTESSSILKIPDWISMNIYVHILKHFFKL